ncbi:ribosome biogenesis GTPase Der [Planctomycetales bacterium ZRK34]|nr:ribosome biogenesis GTPase Der [Planctomycetales bacterium ZRK34]
MLPKVAIVGRPNVGKSSLLNMLAGRRVSIVDPTAGVTRDRVTYELELPPAKKGGEPRFCEVVDTGGYGVYSGDDSLSPLTDDVERQITYAVGEAALILFLIDAQTGITPLDEQVSQLLREQAGDLSRVVLIANKVDSPKLEADALEATSLGFGEPVMVSATTGRGKASVVDLLTGRIDFTNVIAPPKSEMSLAIVGKRNAGKSTFVNALAHSERVIVSELAGTTRDSVDVRFEVDGRSFTAIDTAGVRKRKSLEDDIEYYSLHRALRAIRRADVVMLLIDATVPVSQVDKKLSGEIVEHFKPCVVVVNKWDLVADKLKPEDYVDYLADALRGLDYMPIAFISAKDNDGLADAVTTACELYEQAGQRIGTGRLNAFVQELLERRGPSTKLGTRAKIYYATMVAVHPPTIAIFVNEPDMFDQRYQRYLINAFRDEFPFGEVPIKLLVRRRKRTDRHAEPAEES